MTYIHFLPPFQFSGAFLLTICHPRALQTLFPTPPTTLLPAAEASTGISPLSRLPLAFVLTSPKHPLPCPKTGYVLSYLYLNTSTVVFKYSFIPSLVQKSESLVLAECPASSRPGIQQALHKYTLQTDDLLWFSLGREGPKVLYCPPAIPQVPCPLWSGPKGVWG